MRIATHSGGRRAEMTGLAKLMVAITTLKTRFMTIGIIVNEPFKYCGCN